MSAADVDLDDVAARALASIILERTADAIHDGGAKAAAALEALAADTGLVLDVAAGLLYATTWLAGAGGIEAQAVHAASMALQPDDDEAPPVVLDAVEHDEGDAPDDDEAPDIDDGYAGLLDDATLRTIRERAAADEDYELMAMCDQALVGDVTARVLVTDMRTADLHPTTEAQP